MTRKSRIGLSATIVFISAIWLGLASAMLKGPATHSSNDDDDGDAGAPASAELGRTTDAARDREDVAAAREEADIQRAIENSLRDPTRRRRAVTLRVGGDASAATTSSSSTSTTFVEAAPAVERRPAEDPAFSLLQASARDYTARAVVVASAFKKSRIAVTARAQAENALLSALGEVDAHPIGDARAVGPVPGAFSRDVIEYTADKPTLQAARGQDAVLPSGLARRVESLDAAIEAARRLFEKLDSTPANASGREALRGLIDGASAHSDALRKLIADTLATYPNSLAGINRPRGVTLTPVAAGANASVAALRYNFSDGRAGPGPGSEPALFKEDATGLLRQDPGMSDSGVDTGNPDTGSAPATPMRLTFRARATDIVEETLNARRPNINRLVVRTTLASVGDQNGQEHFGIIMAAAGGVKPVDRQWSKIPASDPRVLQLLNDKKAIATARGQLARMPFVFDANGKPDPNSPREVFARQIQTMEHNFNQNYLKLRNVGRDDAANADWQELHEGRAIRDAVLQDKNFRRALANAELLDHICGQIDRHMGNILVDASARPIVVKLIDNDLSFAKGDFVGDFEIGGYIGKTTPAQGARADLPKVVDRDMKAAILDLTGQQLADAVSGLLTADEVLAMQIRLETVQAHLRTLTRPDQIVTLDGDAESRSWGDPEADLFYISGAPNNPDNKRSYYGEIAKEPLLPGM